MSCFAVICDITCHSPLLCIVIEAVQLPPLMT